MNKLTRPLRKLLDDIDAAMSRGGHVTADNLWPEVQNLALDVSIAVHNWAAEDWEALSMSYAQHDARRGVCPDPMLLPLIGPKDIRDIHGHFLPKAVQERIYQCWQNGSHQDVSFFLAYRPLVASEMR